MVNVDERTPVNKPDRLATTLSRLSPTSSYQLAVMELAGTGMSRHNRFLRFLDEYRKEFRNYFDDLERQQVEMVERFDNVPRFSFPEDDLRSVISRVLPDIGVLALLTVVAFIGAYVAFIRYDVR